MAEKKQLEKKEHVEKEKEKEDYLLEMSEPWRKFYKAIQKHVREP